MTTNTIQIKFNLLSGRSYLCTVKKDTIIKNYLNSYTFKTITRDLGCELDFDLSSNIQDKKEYSFNELKVDLNKTFDDYINESEIIDNIVNFTLIIKKQVINRYVNGIICATLKDNSVEIINYDIIENPYGQNFLDLCKEDVVELYSSYYEYVILKKDGKVYSSSTIGIENIVSNIKKIISHQTAFAALTEEGTIHIWGMGEYKSLGTGYINVYNSMMAFVGLKKDGTACVWGNPDYGGDSKSISLTNIISIVSTSKAFAALKKDSTVIAWGETSHGGDCSVLTKNYNIVQLFATNYAFAALKNDGTVETWGYKVRGGYIPININEQLVGIKIIYANESAFAALRFDGTAIFWGECNISHLYNIIDIHIDIDKFIAIDNNYDEIDIF